MAIEVLPPMTQPLPTKVGAGRKYEVALKAQKEGGKQINQPFERKVTVTSSVESPFDDVDSVDMGMSAPTESWNFNTEDPANSLTLKKAHAAATGAALANIYLKFNQAAYAVAALPIGTVLSIAPLYLKEVMKVEVHIIGYLMMAGEFLGIAFMKYAELSKTGFFVPRPHDLNLILLSVSVCLGLLPLWPRNLWYISAGFMMLVQSFNSASKPVVAEAVHRMAVLVQTTPCKAFALGNKWRRIGNAIIGASAPLVYMVEPRLMFFIVGPALLAFALMHIWFMRRVEREVQDLQLLQAAGVSLRGSQDGSARISTVSGIRSLLDAATLSWPSQASERSDQKSTVGSRGFWVLQLLVVHAFPTMDAFISRLPFAFMTIAIAAGSGDRIIACVVLLSYQSARAVSQSIQTYCIGNAINYLLTSVSIVAYAVVLVMVLTKAGSVFWYIPVVFTGLSETLPVQQYYLTQIFENQGDSNQDAVRERIRELVKQSHTGTGIGSAVAFLTSSQIYYSYNLAGVAVLGLGVAVLKLLTVLIIGVNMP